MKIAYKRSYRETQKLVNYQLVKLTGYYNGGYWQSITPQKAVIWCKFPELNLAHADYVKELSG